MTDAEDELRIALRMAREQAAACQLRAETAETHLAVQMQQYSAAEGQLGACMRELQECQSKLQSSCRDAEARARAAEQSAEDLRADLTVCR